MHSLFKQQTIFKIDLKKKKRINYRRFYKDNITLMQTTAQTQQTGKKRKNIPIST